MNERRLWNLLGVLVLAGLISGLVTRHPFPVVPRLAEGLPEPLPQTAKTRTVRPAPLEATALVPAGPGQDLGRPGLVQAGPDGSAFVVDYRDLRIKRVFTDGTVVPVAEGVVALDNPTGLARDGAGRLWVAEPKTDRLVVLEPDGQVARSITLREPALRLAFAPDGRLFALTPSAEGHLFEAFDDPAEPAVATFGRLFEPPYQTPWTVDGELTATPTGGLVYAPRYLGLLARYDGTGELRFLVEEIEPVGPPTLIRQDGRLRGDREAPRASLAVQVVGDAILTVHPHDGGGSAFVDLYAFSDGTYRESWRLERPWSAFAVAGDRVYALTARGLELFRRTDGHSAQ